MPCRWIALGWGQDLAWLSLGRSWPDRLANQPPGPVITPGKYDYRRFGAPQAKPAMDLLYVSGQPASPDVGRADAKFAQLCGDLALVPWQRSDHLQRAGKRRTGWPV